MPAIRLILGVALVLALALPATSAVAQQPAPGAAGICAPSQGGDAMTTLGACSLQCLDVSKLDADTQRNCRTSGVISRPHPIDSYGLDVNVDVDVLEPTTWILAALQWVASLLWTIALYVTNGTLLALEWAFTLPLLERADVMAKVRDGVGDFHNRILGDTWMLLAMSLGVLGAIWHGLVRRRTIETAAGLLATVSLMIAAMVLIQRPDAVVKPIAEVANAGAMQILSGVSTGGLGNEEQGLANTSQGIFVAVIEEPWCALTFGNQKYCEEVRDAWLARPANDNVRTAMYAKLAGEDDNDAIDDAVDEDETTNPITEEELDKIGEDKQRVYLQGADGTMTRLGLLIVIIAGLVGANLFFGWLAFRLLLAAILSLIYLTMAAVMLLVAALGQAGRESCVSYAMKLTGVVVAKFIYGAVFGVAYVEIHIVTSLELGFFVTWVFVGASWWGLFIYRDTIVGYFSLDQRTPTGLGQGSDDSHGRRGGGFSLQNMMYARQIAGGMARDLTAAPRAAMRGARGGARVLNRNRAERASATSEALRDRERRQSEDDALTRAATHKNDVDGRHSAAMAELAHAGESRDELADAQARAGDELRGLEDRRAELAAERAALQTRSGGAVDASLQSQLDRYSADIGALDTQIGERRSSMDANREALAAHDTHIGNVRSQLADAESEQESASYLAASRHLEDYAAKAARERFGGGASGGGGSSASGPSPTPMTWRQRRRGMRKAKAEGMAGSVRQDARIIKRERVKGGRMARRHENRTRRRAS